MISDKLQTWQDEITPYQLTQITLDVPGCTKQSILAEHSRSIRGEGVKGKLLC